MCVHISEGLTKLEFRTTEGKHIQDCQVGERTALRFVFSGLDCVRCLYYRIFLSRSFHFLFPPLIAASQWCYYAHCQEGWGVCESIVVAGSRQPWGVFEQARSTEARFIQQAVKMSDRNFISLSIPSSSFCLPASPILTDFHPRAWSPLPFFYLRATLCLCFLSRVCVRNVSALPERLFSLSSLPWDLFEYACYSASDYLWKQARSGLRLLKGGAAHRQTCFHTFSPALCLHVSCFWCCFFHMAALSHVKPPSLPVSHIRVSAPCFDLPLPLALTFKHIHAVRRGESLPSSFLCILLRSTHKFTL